MTTPISEEMMTHGLGRGFLYASECAYILTVDSGINIPVNIIHSATKIGLLKFRRSPPSKVKEIDIPSFVRYAATFRPRPNRRGK